MKEMEQIKRERTIQQGRERAGRESERGENNNIKDANDVESIKLNSNHKIDTNANNNNSELKPA